MQLFESEFEIAKIAAETVDLSALWYATFVENPENAVRSFVNLEMFPGLYRRRFETINEPITFELIDFESDTFEKMDISFIRITLPDDDRIFTSRVKCVYLTYTKTEDSFGCPQFYYVKRFRMEDGNEFDNLFSMLYYDESRFEAVTYDEESEEDEIIKQYLVNAKSSRERELMLKELAENLRQNLI